MVATRMERTWTFSCRSGIEEGGKERGKGGRGREKRIA